MVSPPIFMVSGLPRSGSTLLMNLLGQNPAHHVTPSNALVDMMVRIRDTWTSQPEFQAQQIEKIKPRVNSMLKGMIEGFYRDEFAAGKVVFDKSRAWLAYIELIEEVLGRPISILVTVRDIRAIVASVEKLVQHNPLTVPRPENYYLSQSIEGRASLLLSESGPLGWAVTRLRDAQRRRHHSRLLIVPYDQLCQDTQGMMDRLHKALDLPLFRYDPNHVEQITQEDDEQYGMPLHNIRSMVKLGDKEPWKGVLPEPLCERLARDFPDIQRMAKGE